MLGRLFVAALAAATAIAQQGPSALYTLLNGRTFNPPGYTIVMYQSCMQNQNAGNPCGSFSSYQSANGAYTYQLYGPEAPVSPTCSRTFKLTLACGPTMQMSGVNENPTCVYSATLSLPEVCGVSLVVGQEAASVSPTALPPTTTPTVTSSVTATGTGTGTGTATGTGTGTGTATGTGTTTSTGTASMTLTATPTSSTTTTGTPLFQITAWPTTSSTMTLTATGTPLYMITAWPTPSPVNVSATSTPLYYYTAYPSVGSNSSGLLGLASSLTASASPTAIILGSVALGIVGLGAIAGGIAYMRKGGTVGGLLAKVEANKGAMASFANALPISAEQKAKLTDAIADPSSLLPPEARAQAEALKAQATALAEKAASVNASVLAALPPQISSVIEAKQAEVVGAVQVAIEQKKEMVLSAVNSYAPVAVVESVAPLETVAQTVAAATQVTIDPEQLEAFRAFLAQQADKK